MTTLLAVQGGVKWWGKDAYSKTMNVPSNRPKLVVPNRVERLRSSASARFVQERDFFNDSLRVRIHFINEMIGGPASRNGSYANALFQVAVYVPF